MHVSPLHPAWGWLMRLLLWVSIGSVCTLRLDDSILDVEHWHDEHSQDGEPGPRKFNTSPTKWDRPLQFLSSALQHKSHPRSNSQQQPRRPLKQDVEKTHLFRQTGLSTTSMEETAVAQLWRRAAASRIDTGNHVSSSTAEHKLSGKKLVPGTLQQARTQAQTRNLTKNQAQLVVEPQGLLQTHIQAYAGDGQFFLTRRVFSAVLFVALGAALACIVYYHHFDSSEEEGHAHEEHGRVASALLSNRYQRHFAPKNISRGKSDPSSSKSAKTEQSDSKKSAGATIRERAGAVSDFLKREVASTPGAAKIGQMGNFGIDWNSERSAWNSEASQKDNVSKSAEGASGDDEESPYRSSPQEEGTDETPGSGKRPVPIAAPVDSSSSFEAYEGSKKNKNVSIAQDDITHTDSSEHLPSEKSNVSPANRRSSTSTDIFPRYSRERRDSIAKECFVHDWALMKVEGIHCEEEEFTQVKAILQRNYYWLLSLYRKLSSSYVPGTKIQPGITAFGVPHGTAMNLLGDHEHGIDIFDDDNLTYSRAESLFKAVLSQPAHSKRKFAVRNSTELVRYQFIEWLLHVAAVKYPNGSLSNGLQNLLLALQTTSEHYSGDVRVLYDAGSSDIVSDVYKKYASQLKSAFVKAAAGDKASKSNKTIDLVEWAALLRSTSTYEKYPGFKRDLTGYAFRLGVDTVADEQFSINFQEMSLLQFKRAIGATLFLSEMQLEGSCSAERLAKLLEDYVRRDLATASLA